MLSLECIMCASLLTFLSSSLFLVALFLALAPVRVYEDQLTPRAVALPENRKAVEICTR
jgi:hypothetical protein